MESLEEIGREVVDAWRQLEEAVALSMERWNDRILESEDANMDAWSPRLSTWHTVAGERIREAYVRHLVDNNPESPPPMMEFASTRRDKGLDMETLGAEFRLTRTPEDMRAKMAEVRDAYLRMLAELREEDLARTATQNDFIEAYVRSHGQRSSNDVRGVLVHGIVHLRDHAHHIRTSVGA